MPSDTRSINCKECGHLNPDDARFCSNCGTALSRPEAPGDTTSTISISGIEAFERDTGEFVVAEPAAERLAPGTALLVVMRGPNAGSKFLLDRDLTSAGRHPESDIFLDDVTVSRRHAEFARRGSSFTARDVGSLNGTYVNRERIEEVTLANSDEVQIGKFRLVFLTGSGAPQTQDG